MVLLQINRKNREADKIYYLHTEYAILFKSSPFLSDKTINFLLKREGVYMEISKQTNKETGDKEKLKANPEKEPTMTKKQDKKLVENFKKRYCI